MSTPPEPGTAAAPSLPALDRDPWPRSLSVVARGCGIAVFIVAALTAAPAPARPYTAALVAVVVGGMAFAVWSRRQGPWRILLGLGIATAAGDLLYALQPRSVASLVSVVAVPMALVRLSNRQAMPFVAAAIGAVALIGWIGDSPGTGVGLVAGCLGASTIGISIRAARERAVTAVRLLESERETREANARMHVLTERQRLAREIHDILAHTLSAQIVRLEGARLLLRRGSPADEVLEQIDQAQRLARDGLAETKRALYSLRGASRPLPEAVAALAETAGAQLRVEGEPAPVEPETSLALERTVQEALTNARKHAPGGAVTVVLRFDPAAYEVEVTDTGAAGGRAPLAGSGGGYGLTGLRERAELLGGELRAGPDGRGFRVWLRIPR